MARAAQTRREGRRAGLARALAAPAPRRARPTALLAAALLAATGGAGAAAAVIFGPGATASAETPTAVVRAVERRPATGRAVR